MHEAVAPIVLDSLDALLEGLQIIDSDFRYFYVNETAARHGRRSKASLIGRLMSEVYPGIEATEMFAALRACMQDRAPRRLENEFTYPDGTQAWFELSLRPCSAGVCILSSDISERKQAEKSLKALEDQLRHAQKMEAIGRLAAGVAHDLNNIVTVIQLNCGLLHGVLQGDAESLDELAEIRMAGERAAALNRQLLTLGRRQPIESQALDLNALIEKDRPILARLAGDEVTLAIKAGAGLHAVLADPNQIGQVLMNLVVNARDAMPVGGTLTIETANVHLNGEYTSTHLGVAPGDYVMLAVTDTGSGMDAETQARIFEPFFTTKEPGKGTGLGLPTSYGIVKQSGGHIWVYSEPGQGTTFKIYLPRHAAGEPVAAAEPPAPGPVAGSECVLIVENDAKVRTSAADVLVKAGYRVLTAETAAAARRHAARHEVEVLLTDVNLESANGVDLARELAVDRPRLRVIHMSGFTNELALRRRTTEANPVFLQKPLMPEMLLQTVRRVLDEAR